MKEKKKKEKKEKKNKEKKIRVKDAFRIRKGKGFRRDASGRPESSVTEGTDFGAMIHSAEPILKLKEVKGQPSWMNDLALNLSCAALAMTAIALFCMSIDEPYLILFSIPCLIVFMAVVTVGNIRPGKAKWIAAAAAAVILLATGLIWREEIFGGLSMLINLFYDVAEQAQAYIYDRLPGGYGSDKAAIAWISCCAGLLAALPPVKYRRGISIFAVIFMMIALAYYGLIPSAVCIAFMIAALIAAASRGSALSFVPVVLAALVLFGAVVLVDPGENYAVSRIDENLRDRFALSSALLETDTSTYEEEEEDYEDSEDDWENEDEESEESDYGTYAVYGFLILLAAALGAAAYMLYRRFSRKRAENRRGLDSKDAREAVTAMFPYAVRWLKGYGIVQTEPAVTSMVPEIEDTFSGSYADRFEDMYSIWSEAAYSDHEVTETSRQLMDVFMKDTIKMVDEKCKLKDKIRLKFRHAL